jgi:2-succinyl-5-enolpyruvyl-6-hydroxy-3-cyclohexene-1-carboxylate synthase
MIHNAPNINHLWSRLIVEELRRNGVDTFYISPGSRSTPLTVAAAQTEGVRTYVHFDERGAAFAAMGHAMGSERPTALICTSGSAAANYLPAIVEASQSGTPLIVLTADRPPELTDAGANQAIDQTGLYRNFVRWEHALPCPTQEMPAQAVLTAIDQAVFRSNGIDPGPVHINCPFREPLAPTNTGDDWTEYLVPLEPWLGSDAPYTTYARSVPELSQHDLDQLERILLESERGLIVFGRLVRQPERDAASAIAEHLGWATLRDVLAAPIVFGSGGLEYWCYDLLLASEKFSDGFQPDTVVHLGGPLVSKRLLSHLATSKLKHYVRITSDFRRNDPAHLTTLKLAIAVESAHRALTSSDVLSDLPNRLAQLEWMKRVFKVPQDKLLDILDSVFESEDEELTEPSLMRRLETLHKDSPAIFFGNSMPVRDADMFFLRVSVGDGAYAANRGASGIDGNIATAAGLTRGSQRRVTAVVGDLAALHDLNSIALLRDCDPPVTLVIINNDGGGIFHFLPVAEAFDEFETYFGTPHGLTFRQAAVMFGLDFYHPSNMEAFIHAFGESQNAKRSTIIEVRTDREENVRLHREILQRVREAIDG